MRKFIPIFISAVFVLCSGCSGAAGEQASMPSPSSATEWMDRLQLIRQSSISLANPEHGELVCTRSDRYDQENGHYYSDIEIRSKEGDYRRHITYATRLWHMPESVDIWLQGVDLNGDGADDIIMDLGISGKLLPSYGFVYDSGSDCFVPICGYSTLVFPECCFSAEGQPMIVATLPDPWLEADPDYHFGWNKYVVSGNRLELISTVMLKYEGDTGGYITEKQWTDGTWSTVQSHVKEDEFDLEAWMHTYSEP